MATKGRKPYAEYDVWKKEGYKNRRSYASAIVQQRTRAKATELLGGKCACCGTKDDLHFDHIKPERRGSWHIGPGQRARRVLKNPEKFQLLCKPCNEWKSNGPRCPCKWWDEISPTWRSDLFRDELVRD